jgi:lysophospholipase L1-like esterase
MKHTVVLLGDSLTSGGEFKETENIPEVEVHNLGVSGDTTWGILARLHRIWDLSPEFVFLLAGINDLGHGERPEDIVVRHKRIWEAVRSPENGPTLVLHPLIPVNPRRFPAGNWNLKNTVIYDLNFHLECAAANLGIPILDFRAPLMDRHGDLREEYTLDGLHLVKEAYVLWDRELCAFLKSKIS